MQEKLEKCYFLPIVAAIYSLRIGVFPPFLAFFGGRYITGKAGQDPVVKGLIGQTISWQAN